MLSCFRELFVLLLAYGIGAFPTGYLFSLFFSGTDLRTFGSGTGGASNTARLLGPLGFVAVFFVDVGKAYAILTLCLLFIQGAVSPFFLALAVILGNIFSYGPACPRGKGVSTALGCLLFFNIPLFFVFVFAWLATILFCKIPTYASLMSCLVTFVASFFFVAHCQIRLFLVVLQFILFYTHRRVVQKSPSYESLVCYLKRLLKNLLLLRS